MNRGKALALSLLFAMLLAACGHQTATATPSETQSTTAPAATVTPQPTNMPTPTATAPTVAPSVTGTAAQPSNTTTPAWTQPAGTTTSNVGAACRSYKDFGLNPTQTTIETPALPGYFLSVQFYKNGTNEAERQVVLDGGTYRYNNENGHVWLYANCTRDRVVAEAKASEAQRAQKQGAHIGGVVDYDQVKDRFVRQADNPNAAPASSVTTSGITVVGCTGFSNYELLPSMEEVATHSDAGYYLLVRFAKPGEAEQIVVLDSGRYKVAGESGWVYEISGCTRDKMATAAKAFASQRNATYVEPSTIQDRFVRVDNGAAPSGASTTTTTGTAATAAPSKAPSAPAPKATTAPQAAAPSCSLSDADVVPHSPTKGSTWVLPGNEAWVIHIWSNQWNPNLNPKNFPIPGKQTGQSEFIYVTAIQPPGQNVELPAGSGGKAWGYKCNAAAQTDAQKQRDEEGFIDITWDQLQSYAHTGKLS